MFTNRLSDLMEKQRRRMILTMLEVCDSEQRAQILAEEQQRQNRGQLPVSQRKVAATDQREVDGRHTVSPIALEKTSGAATRNNNEKP